jgi:hypoxanthine phosphoribosyltransferase
MEKLVKLNDRTFRLYKSETEILSAVRDVAHQINEDYIGKRPLIIPVLNGSFMFASDLVKELMLDCELCFIKAASYTGTQSNGTINTLIGLSHDVEGRHIIIVEDIVDTGNTLAKILPELMAKNPASLKVATLLLKPLALKNDLTIDYVGIEIANEFIVGYGLDYDGLGRNLRDIYQVIED